MFGSLRTAQSRCNARWFLCRFDWVEMRVPLIVMDMRIRNEGCHTLWSDTMSLCCLFAGLRWNASSSDCKSILLGLHVPKRALFRGWLLFRIASLMRQFARHVRFIFACSEMFLQVGSFLDCRPLGSIAPSGVGDLKVLESRPAVDATSR